MIHIPAGLWINGRDTRHERGRGNGTRFGAFCSVCSAALFGAFAAAAGAQTVYRCDDGKGGVLYADVPCKQGIRVDIPSGKADPAAIERLQREQRAFAARQAARDARAEREAVAARAERESERQRQRDAWLASQVLPDPYVWDGWWPWFPIVPVVPPPPPRPRPERPSGYLPATPGRVSAPIPGNASGNTPSLKRPKVRT